MKFGVVHIYHIIFLCAFLDYGPKFPHDDGISSGSTANKPFTIPCIVDRSTSIEPSNIDVYRYINGNTEVENPFYMKFNWQLESGSSAVQYNDIISASAGRIKMDPVTGSSFILVVCFYDFMSQINILTLTSGTVVRAIVAIIQLCSLVAVLHCSVLFTEICIII